MLLQASSDRPKPTVNLRTSAYWKTRDRCSRGSPVYKKTSENAAGCLFHFEEGRSLKKQGHGPASKQFVERPKWASIPASNPPFSGRRSPRSLWFTCFPARPERRTDEAAEPFDSPLENGRAASESRTDQNICRKDSSGFESVSEYWAPLPSNMHPFQCIYVTCLDRPPQAPS